MIKYEFQLNNVPKLKLLKSLSLVFVMFVENIQSRKSFSFLFIEMASATTNNQQQQNSIFSFQKKHVAFILKQLSLVVLWAVHYTPVFHAIHHVIQFRL